MDTVKHTPLERELLEALDVAVNELEWQLERGNGTDVTRAALSIVRSAISKSTVQGVGDE